MHVQVDMMQDIIIGAALLQSTQRKHEYAKIARQTSIAHLNNGMVYADAHHH